MATPRGKRGGSGFWRGFVVGLGLALLVALGLAWAFPPLRAPEVDERALTPPQGPFEPPAAGHPGRAAPEDALSERPALPAVPVRDGTLDR